jgi:spore maturation protein CgeB
MKVVIFAHSLLSDWNHGNAHFLRGIVVEMQSRGIDVQVYEAQDAWSVVNLVADHGEAALRQTASAYPALPVTRYDPSTLDLDRALDQASLVLVHEWNAHELVRRIGRHGARRREYVLLFHDTHHRSVSSPGDMDAYDLSAYDGVLAFGEVVRQRYLARGWTARAWTWHEAADTRLFRPLPEVARERDLVWIGNWGDDERTAEIEEFLVAPVASLQVRTTVHGVRYPAPALERLRRAGIDYRGWLPNYRVPEVFARHRVTVHVPRRPYVRDLPGIPTIRPFEALACAIPLVSAPWNDVERLFRPGVDYLVAGDEGEMTRHLRDVLHDDGLAATLAARGRETILARHTCGHRVDELLAILQDIRGITADRSVCA